MKVGVENGKVELYSERQFAYALAAIWGCNLVTARSANGEVDSYLKFDHVVAAWSTAPARGWIAVPHFVMNGRLLQL